MGSGQAESARAKRSVGACDHRSSLATQRSFHQAEIRAKRASATIVPLLKVARQRDQATQSNLVAFPGREHASGSMPAALTQAESSLSIVDDKDWESEVTRPGGPSIGLGFDTNRLDGTAVIELPIAARVAPNGAIIDTADEDLADAVAYAGRLAGLIGEMLGLDGFRALECASKDERIVIYVEEQGGLVAGRVPAIADVSLLRERLGL
jgi:hypothetical protein